MRRLLKSTRGASMIETAFVVLLLMLMVIGIGTINAQIYAIEHASRGVDEIGHIAVQLVEEEGSLTPASQATLLEIAQARTRSDDNGLLLRIDHISRNGLTGDYVVLNTYEMGNMVRPSIVSVASLPDPLPGITVFGETIELDLGGELMVVYLGYMYQPIPEGLRSPELYEQVSVVPVLE